MHAHTPYMSLLCAGVMALAIVSAPSAASAQSIYTDTWYADAGDAAGNTRLFGTATGSYYNHGFRLRISLKAPSGTVLASDEADAFSYAEFHTSTVLNPDTAEDGTYEALGEMWADDGVHIGCQIAQRRGERFSARFQRAGPVAGGRIRYVPSNCAHKCQAQDQCVPTSVTQAYLAARGFFWDPPGACSGLIIATNIYPACFGPPGTCVTCQYSTPCP